MDLSHGRRSCTLESFDERGPHDETYAPVDVIHVCPAVPPARSGKLRAVPKHDRRNGPAGDVCIRWNRSEAECNDCTGGKGDGVYGGRSC